MNPLITAGIVLAMLGGVFFAGDRYGRNVLQAKLDAATVKIQEVDASKVQALAAAEQKRHQTVQDFEDKLNAIPVAGGSCIKSEWVR